jgi:acid phosphatase
MAYLAMHDLVLQQLHFFMNNNNDDNDARVLLMSAHDSTLLGLLCAYRLTRPAVWPPYASYLVLELVQCTETNECFVRFSLNGERLQSQWETNDGDDEEEEDGNKEGIAYDMIPLSVLHQKVTTVGAEPSGFAQVS